MFNLSYLKVSLTVALASVSMNAHAKVVYFNDFNNENGGVPATGLTALSGISTPSGSVDLTSSACASGLCLNLHNAGWSPGLIGSQFSFASGDLIKFSFDMAGGDPSGAFQAYNAGFVFSSPIDLLNYGTGFNGNSFISVPTANSVPNFGTSFSNSGDSALANYAFFFTAASSGSGHFQLGTFSTGMVGSVVDNLKLEISSSSGAVPEPSTWAMMIFGFGAVGMAMRARRSMTMKICYAF